MKQVKSIKELIKLTLGEEREFRLLLMGGFFSRKTIEYDGYSELFMIHNHINNTEEELTQKELKKSNIGKAIKKGAFILVKDEK